MGLDMNLKAERYVSDVFEKEQELFNELMGAVNRHVSTPIPTSSDHFQSLSIAVNLVYWRKANQIHGWFVANVQDGIDECQPSHLSSEALEELIGMCNTLLINRGLYHDGEITEKELVDCCNELLPPQSGFFFGSTEIDEWYWEDIQHTYDSLTKVWDWLKAEKEAGHYWTLVYEASW